MKIGRHVMPDRFSPLFYQAARELDADVRRIMGEPRKSIPIAMTRAAGPRLAEARLNAQLSQRALAEQAGVSHETISHIERGTHTMSQETYRKLRAVLDI